MVRIFIRKKNSTTITNSAPSSSDSCRLEMELSMKELWRNMSVEIFTSEGRVDFSSSSDLSIFSVRAIVPAAGCFVTVSITAGCASTEAVPMRGSLCPRLTSAMSETSTIPLLSGAYYGLADVFGRSSVNIGLYEVFVAVFI